MREMFGIPVIDESADMIDNSMDNENRFNKKYWGKIVQVEGWYPVYYDPDGYSCCVIHPEFIKRVEDHFRKAPPAAKEPTND